MNLVLNESVGPRDAHRVSFFVTAHPKEQRLSVVRSLLIVRASSQLDLRAVRQFQIFHSLELDAQPPVRCLGFIAKKHQRPIALNLDKVGAPVSIEVDGH